MNQDFHGFQDMCLGKKARGFYVETLVSICFYVSKPLVSSRGKTEAAVGRRHFAAEAAKVDLVEQKRGSSRGVEIWLACNTWDIGHVKSMVNLKVL